MKKVILKLLLLLIFYLLFVIMFSSTTFQGDEDGYVGSANQIAQGSFSNLWWGPGYPIVLVPFVLLKLPWFVAKILNAFFLFGAILYFYRTSALWLNEPYPLILSFVMGLYPPFWIAVHLLASENIVFFLICGFMFHFCRSHKETKSTWIHLLIASLFLGYLALTKVFFGYVIFVGLFSFLILCIWKKSKEYKKTFYIYLLAFIWCLPFLLYTYSLTGKILYWGTSGGMSLYWMSTPYKDELGDWFSVTDVQERPELAQNREFFDQITGLSNVEQDSAFKKQAINNITHQPAKYFINWMANIGRLLFSYPFSFTQQKLTTYFYLIPNIFIVVLFILSIYPAILRRKYIPYELFALLYFSFIAFGGTSLLSAYERQFRPFVPVLLLWLSFLYVHIIKIEIRPASEFVRLGTNNG